MEDLAGGLTIGIFSKSCVLGRDVGVLRVECTGVISSPDSEVGVAGGF